MLIGTKYSWSDIRSFVIYSMFIRSTFSLAFCSFRLIFFAIFMTMIYARHEHTHFKLSNSDTSNQSDCITQTNSVAAEMARESKEHWHKKKKKNNNLLAQPSTNFGSKHFSSISIRFHHRSYASIT